MIRWPGVGPPMPPRFYRAADWPAPMHCVRWHCRHPFVDGALIFPVMTRRDRVGLLCTGCAVRRPVGIQYAPGKR